MTVSDLLGLFWVWDMGYLSKICPIKRFRRRRISHIFFGECFLTLTSLREEAFWGSKYAHAIDCPKMCLSGHLFKALYSILIMDWSNLKYFFPAAIIAIAARLFFYPWDYHLEPFGPVWIGTLLIMIFGIGNLIMYIRNDWR
jgi:drug/metabolite transporter (DMT)-like permease